MSTSTTDAARRALHGAGCVARAALRLARAHPLAAAVTMGATYATLSFVRRRLFDARYSMGLDTSCVARMRYRPGDIVVSTPPKTGTTWTLHMLYQLTVGGRDDYDDLLVETPWLEYVERLGQPFEELMWHWERLPLNRRRVFKTHVPPPLLAVRPDVYYVVVLRDPFDTMLSYYHFMRNLNVHAARAQRFWFIRVALLTGLFPPSSLNDMLAMQKRAPRDPYCFVEHVRQWWPLRHQPNVLLLHFADMKRDLDGTLRRLAAFARIDVGPDTLERAAHFASFKWMKQHNERFALPRLRENGSNVELDGMVRKGAAGGDAAATGEWDDKSMAAAAAFFKKHLTAEQLDFLQRGDAALRSQAAHAAGVADAAAAATMTTTTASTLPPPATVFRGASS